MFAFHAALHCLSAALAVCLGAALAAGGAWRGAGAAVCRAHSAAVTLLDYVGLQKFPTVAAVVGRDEPPLEMEVELAVDGRELAA